MGNVVKSGFVIPIVLLVWCIVFRRIKNKNKNATLEELKNFYWLKNSNGNERIEEKYYCMQNIIFEIIYIGLFIFWILICMAAADIYDFGALKSFVSSVAFWNVLEVNIGILTVISLVITLKKEYYLGITIKDVMKLYEIPDSMIKILICSSILFIFYGIYNISLIKNDEIRSMFVELLIYTFMLLILENLIVLLYRTINICINSSKKEMKTFKCLRYKIAYEYQLKQNEPINSGAVEKISTYLVKEVQKYYKSFREKADKLVEVQYDSTILLMDEITENDKKYNRKFRKKGTILIGFISFFILGVLTFSNIQIKERGYIKILIIEMILTLFLIIIGAKMNVWNIFVANRSFFVFKYDVKGEGIPNREEIAAFGFGRYNKRYNFIGAIEDLISFYKILLHNQQGEMVRDIVIKKVKEKINKPEDEKLRNTILLLLYYFDYEKYYLESEAKVGRRVKGKNKEEKVRKKQLKR